jgi:signal peptide peptidase SppA
MSKPGIFARLFGRAKQSQTVTSAALLEQIANRPMLMSPLALHSMIAAAESGVTADARLAYREDGDWSPEGSKPEHLITIADGVGYVRIHGPLFPRYDIYTWWFGGTAYDVITAAVGMLAADAGVAQIVLDIDSNGGRVQGCFECSRAIASARASKPITAYVNDAGFSAGYALACAASRIVITDTAGVGSIGVIGTHVDFSRMLESAGVKYTLITSGEKKADLSPTAPLSDRARAELQDEINRLGELFFALVAEHRGLDADAIRALQAGTYYGPAAVSAGLADEVGALTLASVGEDEDEPAPADNPEGEPAATLKLSLAAIADDVAEASGAAPQREMSAEDRQLRDRGIVANAVAAADLPPVLASALLSPVAGVTPETVDTRIAHAKALADMCFAAGLPDMAADYAIKNTEIETARAQLLAAKAEDGPELVTAHPQASPSAGSRLDVAGIYARRKAQTP